MTCRFGVRVLDARGEFVRGLTQSDFQILEDGQPQTITAFSAVDIPFVRKDATIPAPSSGAIRKRVASNESMQVDGRVYAFVLDNQDMDAAMALRARHVVRRFIGEGLAGNDLAAIVVTGNGRVRPFTGHRDYAERCSRTFDGRCGSDRSPGRANHEDDR